MNVKAKRTKQGSLKINKKSKISGLPPTKKVLAEYIGNTLSACT